MFEGKTFRSPSAFSVYVKRKVNPTRKADDGWTSVKYGVNMLSHYRGMLQELTGGASKLVPPCSTLATLHAS